MLSWRELWTGNVILEGARPGNGILEGARPGNVILEGGSLQLLMIADVRAKAVYSPPQPNDED